MDAVAMYAGLLAEEFIVLGILARGDPNAEEAFADCLEGVVGG